MSQNNINFKITDAAASKIIELVNSINSDSKNNEAVKFRISVLGGGCSGFQYKYDFDNTLSENEDIVFSHNNAELIIDNISINLLKDSTIDYVETLGSAGFEIKNPNATAKCGCGNSFGI